MGQTIVLRFRAMRSEDWRNALENLHHLVPLTMKLQRRASKYEAKNDISLFPFQSLLGRFSNLYRFIHYFCSNGDIQGRTTEIKPAGTHATVTIQQKQNRDTATLPQVVCQARNRQSGTP